MSRSTANPALFDPTIGLTGYGRPASFVVETQKNQKQQEEKEKEEEEEDVRREKRRKSSVAAFQPSLDAELNPYIVIENDQTVGSVVQQKPHVVRLRILVEPTFSRQEKTAGSAEEQFRQIVFDRGITDESLVSEIRRGINNEYELGTPQPLRNVHDYVDYSSEALSYQYIKEHAVGNLILSSTFRYLVLFVILLNAILIGLETNPVLSIKFGSWFEGVENCIMAAFILEILVKWYYNFDVFWKGGWNILDFVIICVLFFGSSLKFLGTSRVLRILRVIRAFRSLRDTPLFSGLSLLFQTVTRSLPDMANICLLMVVVICLLGVVGVQLFGEIAPLTFGSFFETVFNIFICQTQRGWVKVFEPFVEAGGAYYWGSFIYFVLTITLTSFVLKNMFIAVVVTSLRKEMVLAQEERERKEAKRSHARPALKVKPADDGDRKEEEEEGESRKTLEPLVEAARKWKTGEVQRRVLLPIFLNLVTVADLQQFLFLQVALEENLQEYQKLRSRLNDLHGQVRSLNKTYFQHLKRPVSSNQAPKRRSKIEEISLG